MLINAFQFPVNNSTALFLVDCQFDTIDNIQQIADAVQKGL